MRKKPELFNRIRPEISGSPVTVAPGAHAWIKNDNTSVVHTDNCTAINDGKVEFGSVRHCDSDHYAGEELVAEVIKIELS